MKMAGSSVDTETVQPVLMVLLIFIITIIETIVILVMGIVQPTVTGEEIGIIDSLGLAISSISNGGWD